MKEHPVTSSAPYNFPRCFNDSCAKAANCLHHLATIEDTFVDSVISIINPRCIPEDTNACSHFLTTQKMRVAWGIRHLLDNVPYKNVRPLKAQLMAHFGRSRYYRFYREEYFLTPEHQNYIRQVFRQYGIEQEPAFDSYSDEYRW